MEYGSDFQSDKRVRATVTWPGGAARGEIICSVRHAWDALVELMAEGIVPDADFDISVRQEPAKEVIG